jgi:hypothetical protein
MTDRDLSGIIFTGIANRDDHLLHRRARLMLALFLDGLLALLL